MQKHKLFLEYLDKVGQQIRWNKARPIICKELGDHLEDRQAALIGRGVSEDDAAQEAVLDMGDAVLVGTQLDRSYRPRPAWGIITVVAALLVLGFFARDYIIMDEESYHTVDFAGSIFFVGAAIAALIAGYFLDYTILGKYPLIICAGAVSLTILLSIFNSEDLNGVPYYITYFAAYYVLFMPVVYAAILWWWPYKGTSGLIGCYAVLAVIALVWAVFGWPPLAALNGCICGIMLTAELLNGKFGVNKTYGLAILYGPVAALSIGVMRSSFGEAVWYTILPVIDPWNASGYTDWYTVIHIREKLSQAVWFGKGGITEGMGSLRYMADDFMLTYFIHQIGWISLAVVLLLFGVLFTFSILKIKRQKSKLGRMVASAILAALGLQCAFYVLGNLALAPSLSYLTLPLLSTSNAALLIDSFLFGLMLSVFRTNDITCDAAIEPAAIPRYKITIERISKM